MSPHQTKPVMRPFLAAAGDFASGKQTPRQFLEDSLALLEQWEPRIGAFVCTNLPAARAAAERSTERWRAGKPVSPIDGMPVGIKDIIETVDMPTEMGSALFAGWRSEKDAACVRALRDAGAVIIGKTVTTEFAYFQPGKTRNPHESQHTPGGSSSGSAAAVADFMVPVAFGTQTAASVIRPAAFCGVFGYKASFGEFSLSGIRPLAESMDSLGILARSPADIALMRGVLLGAAETATLEPLANPPRLGICRTAQWPLADPCTRVAVDSAAENLRRAGALVCDVVLPAHFDTLVDDQKTIMAYEAARNYVFETTRFADRLSDAFRALTHEGAKIGRARYRDALQKTAIAALEFETLVGDCDALITPAALGEAPLAATGTGDPVMSRMWTALRVPALAVPFAKGPRGLPIGLQLIAARGADRLLLRVGQWASRVLSAT